MGVRMQKSPTRKVRSQISKQIEKYGLPQSWEKECYDLYQKFISSRSAPRTQASTRKLIDSILLLLCKKNRFIAPKGNPWC